MLASLLAACVAPDPRDLERDKAMQRNSELLRPETRPPLEATEGEPATASLDEIVPQLSSTILLQRLQANNRLAQAGPDGIMTVADFLHTQAPAEQLSEAARFLVTAEFSTLEASQAAQVREALAAALSHAGNSVRIPAARAMRVHGPGAQRTVFLTAIVDPERRVRWEVVQRFSENPTELDKTQRSLLLGYLEAGTRADFATADKNEDGSLTQEEFSGTDVEFARLDRDLSGTISGEEWASPIDSYIRNDIVALLVAMHGKLTPKEMPPLYNPWLPSSDQLDIVTRWRQWSDSLS